MKKECISAMGFRYSHIGINFTSKRIYIYIYIYYLSNIQVGFHLIQNLNPIGIKIFNQFVCFYLINPIKSGIHMEKRKLFKKKLLFYNPKKKTKNKKTKQKKNKNKTKTKTKKQNKTNKQTFFFRRINIYYIQILFLKKKEKMLTLNSNTYYLIYIFFNFIQKNFC